MADFLAAVVAKVAVMLVESLVRWLIQNSFTAFYSSSEETAAAFA